MCWLHGRCVSSTVSTCVPPSSGESGAPRATALPSDPPPDPESGRWPGQDVSTERLPFLSPSSVPYAASAVRLLDHAGLLLLPQILPLL